MRTINLWINFNGNAEEAFTFYKSVLAENSERSFVSVTWQAPDFRYQKMMQIKLCGSLYLLANTIC